MRTKTGEATLKASSFVLAAKCINSLPDKHKGIRDVRVVLVALRRFDDDLISETFNGVQKLCRLFADILRI